MSRGASVKSYGAATFDWSQLLIPLSDFNEINRKHGKHMDLDFCKAWLRSIDMVRSYASDRVRHHDAKFSNFEITPSEDRKSQANARLRRIFVVLAHNGINDS